MPAPPRARAARYRTVVDQIGHAEPLGGPSLADRPRRPRPSTAASPSSMCPPVNEKNTSSKRRLPHLDVVHQHPRGVQRPHHRRRQPGRRVDTRRQPPAVVAHVHLAGHQRGDRRHRSSADDSAASVTSRRAERDASFNSCGVPSAIDATVVHHDDLRGQLVGLLQDTASSAAPSRPRRPARGWRPTHRWRLTGSSPVVGSSRNSTGGRVIIEAARSSRRRMPPE